jgi:hypothetical protein
MERNSANKANLEKALQHVLTKETYNIIPGGITSKLNMAVYDIFIKERENESLEMKKAVKVIRANARYLMQHGEFPF